MCLYTTQSQVPSQWIGRCILYKFCEKVVTAFTYKIVIKMVHFLWKRSCVYMSKIINPWKLIEHLYFPKKSSNRFWKLHSWQLWFGNVFILYMYCISTLWCCEFVFSITWFTTPSVNQFGDRVCGHLSECSSAYK